MNQAIKSPEKLIPILKEYIYTKEGCPPVPESIMSASRNELTNLKLNIIEGTLPKDLRGHVFIIAPVNYVDTNGMPSPDGKPILNGDGMIYRYDFDRPGEARVTSRLVKSPCYYADKATREQTKYAKYKFGNHGLMRFSLSLGFRNLLNTGLVPMKFSDSGAAMLVTYDAGRPYEIDTETLQVVTPVGSNQESTTQR